MTLATELDLGSVKMNQRVKYLGKSSFRLKVIAQSDTQTHRTNRPIPLPGPERGR